MPPAEQAVAVIQARFSRRPALGIVLGSGFGTLVGALETEAVIPYAELPGFPPSSVPGHAGALVLGRLADLPVACFSGRAHFYEGHDLSAVTHPIRVLSGLGARMVLLTNAAGGIRPDLGPGDFVALTDHLNFMGVNPLRGDGGTPRFVDLSEVYSPRLRAALLQAGRDSGTLVKEGVYLAVPGPSYETPAEIRAFATLGADLVGMSTVPEAIVARQCGLEVAGLSCVTNRAAGLGGRISHEEVLAIGRGAADVAGRLARRFAGLLA